MAMSAEMGPAEVTIGAEVIGTGGARIGRVDQVFVDYLLVRTHGLVPVDLYLPTADAQRSSIEVRVDATRDEAYQRWHRPLKSVAHDAVR
jgi:hypothetical protein